MSNKATLYIVQVAQYDESNGELVPFAKAFPTLEKAAKFIVTDYNGFCKSFDDGNTLSKSAWKGLADTRGIDGSSDWPTWIKWRIAKQTVTLAD